MNLVSKADETEPLLPTDVKSRTRALFAAKLMSLDERPAFIDDIEISNCLPVIDCHANLGHRRKIDDWFRNFFMALVKDSRTLGAEVVRLPLYRGIPFASLVNVSKGGIDVVPTDSVIWASDDLGKAFEYGGQNGGAILILDSKKCDWSHRRVSSDAPAEEVRQLDECYGPPYKIDGHFRFYSKLPKEDNRRGSSHEIAYGRFIRQNPFSALLGILRVHPT